MRDCLTYSSPPFLYFYKATLFPWARGCVPFLLLFKHYSDIRDSPSLAQLQSRRALLRSQYVVLFPPQEKCRPEVERELEELGFRGEKLENSAERRKL